VFYVGVEIVFLVEKIPMKRIFILFAMAGITYVSACTESKARYIDLNTGEPIEIEKDIASGYVVNKSTGKPVKIYVDTETNDTIYGLSGAVINEKVRKTSGGEWVYAGEESFKYKKDGDEEKMKIGEDYKYKRDGKAYKLKKGNYKKEVEKDGDITIKDGNRKIKIDAETGERKVKIDD
jgi:hypothetical protein